MTFPITRVHQDMVPAEDLPAPTRGEVVVWGLLAGYPFGGMTWQVLHHLVGLRRLGFEVWYVEDSDAPVFDPADYWPTFDVPEHNRRYLADAMAAVGMADHWILRWPGSDRCDGAGDRSALRALYRRCRAVFNLCGSHELRPEHDEIANLIYLQTDPVALQMEAATNPTVAEGLRRYDHRFTYGANIGRSDCIVPDAPAGWTPTRPPVVVDWWVADRPGQRKVLTTVANWRHRGKDVEWEDETYYWRKDLAFAPYLDLPGASPLPLELALGGFEGSDKADLEARGWTVVPSISIGDPAPYRDYIRSSFGEFSAVKDQVARTRSGWFSDRSVCYLAAGLPVVVQDTGCGTWLPTGEGLLVFNDFDSALAAIESVASDPLRHQRAALELAREYLAAERVLGEIAETVGLG
jgi:hypothetical protein